MKWASGQTEKQPGFFILDFHLRCGQWEGEVGTDEKNSLRPYGLLLKEAPTGGDEITRLQDGPKAK